MTLKNKRQRRGLTALPAFIFLIIIFAVMVLIIFLPKKTFSETENRDLARFPDISFSSITDGTFEKGLDSYLSDHFPARTLFVKANSALKYALGERLINDVYYADKGYLIEYTPKGSIDRERRDTNIDILSGAFDRYSEMSGAGNVMVYMTAAKEDALSDLLPKDICRERLQRIISDLEKVIPKQNIVDCEAIVDNAGLAQKYYRTDHHWTSEAAAAVYSDWCVKNNRQNHLNQLMKKTVTDDFYGSTYKKTMFGGRPDSIDLYQSKSPVTVSYPSGYQVKDKTGMYQMDRLESKDKYEVFFGGNTGVITIHNDNGDGRKLLIYKDSFANCIVPLWAENYSDIMMVDLRYSGGDLNEKLQSFGKPDNVYFFFNTLKFAEESHLTQLEEITESIEDKGQKDEESEDSEDDIMIG